MRDFVHLHLRSQYSLLEGAIRLPDLMDRVTGYGMQAVAVTDRGQMCAAVDFYKRAGKAKIKPIIGIDLAVAEGSRFERDSRAQDHHLVLLARDQTGWAHLRELSTRAWLDADDQQPRADQALLAEHHEGIIALSGGLDGEIPRLIEAGRLDQARVAAARYRDLFGPEGFYLEILATGTPRQRQLNAALRALGAELRIPLVATNDCRYLDRREARAHEVLECIRQGYTLDSRSRPQVETDQYYLKRPDEMWEALGAEYADALENTVRIAEACDLKLALGTPYLPTYPLPAGFDTESYLVKRAQEGLEERYAEFRALGLSFDEGPYQDRLDIELKIIREMGFAGYFLIVQDFINWAKEHGIPVGPGRGSGAGSLVAYALRITDLDPLPYGLLFERFLNPERVSMPDFDIDFCMNRRGEVIEYVTEKYGKNNVGQIATYGGLKAKGVIKDVGRVLGLSFVETDRLSKLVPEVLGITLSQAIAQEPRLKAMADEDPKIADLLSIAQSPRACTATSGCTPPASSSATSRCGSTARSSRGPMARSSPSSAKDEVEKPAW
ncbi:MAG: DNA polymerase III subunit alpha [bacterium]